MCVSSFISFILFPPGAQEWLLHASPVKMNVVSQGETRSNRSLRIPKVFSMRRFRYLRAAWKYCVSRQSFPSWYVMVVMHVCSHSSLRAFARKTQIRYRSSWHARPGLAANLSLCVGVGQNSANPLENLENSSKKTSTNTNFLVHSTKQLPFSTMENSCCIVFISPFLTSGGHFGDDFRSSGKECTLPTSPLLLKSPFTGPLGEYVIVI